MCPTPKISAIFWGVGSYIPDIPKIRMGSLRRIHLARGPSKPSCGTSRRASTMLLCFHARTGFGFWISLGIHGRIGPSPRNASAAAIPMMKASNFRFKKSRSQVRLLQSEGSEEAKGAWLVVRSARSRVDRFNMFQHIYRLVKVGAGPPCVLKFRLSSLPVMSSGHRSGRLVTRVMNKTSS